MVRRRKVKSGFVVTFKQKGKKGLFKGDKVFKTRASAQSSIRRFKRLTKQADSDLPVKSRTKLFFGHRVRKRSDVE